MRRVFLGWQRPGLESAADWLIAHAAGRATIELDHCIVAVPGRRAGRRLLELLVERAEAAGRPLAPPSITTAGGFAERLYELKRPFADPLTQELAWANALKQLSGERLALLTPAPPAADDLAGWLALAAMIGGLHRELTAARLDFKKVIDKQGRQLGAAKERWKLLAEVQTAYLAALDALGVWDQQTARLYAIDRKECRLDGELILLGLVDLNRSQQAMLDLVTDRVTALVVAPQELADRFDPHGGLMPDAWQSLAARPADEQIVVVDDVAAEAEAALVAIAALDGRHPADDIVIGIPDPAVVPYLEQQLAGSAVRVREGAGKPLAQLSPHRLFESLAAYLDGRRFADFAALVRHPMIERWLLSQGVKGDWLSALDRYYAEHLPLRPGMICSAEGVPDLVAAVCQKLVELTAAVDDGRRPLSAWARPLLELAVALLGDRPLDPADAADRQVIHYYDCLAAGLEQLGAVAAALDAEVSAAEALRLVLQQIGDERLAPLADPGAIELLGWLELPWDDAPVQIVAGLNEGLVPSSQGADAFLPLSLRRALDLDDNERRYARDAYALSMMVASRPGLVLLAARRGPEGEPLSPSRLLFDCADEESPVRRALEYFGPRRPPTAVLRGAIRPGRDDSAFAVPLPIAPEPPVAEMSVTHFRDYLACPYRYYLRRVLRLESLDDAAEELDPRLFGTLAHEVLADFGNDPAIRDSADAKAIDDYLQAALVAKARGRFGAEPPPAVRVQLEQLRTRLAALARWQAEQAAEGWRIVEAEWYPKKDDKPVLVLPDGTMRLSGRIDRIDRHVDGRLRIADYKTADSGKSPAQTHLNKGAWVDLQLPLYRYLARAAGLAGADEEPQLGYIVLPKAASGVGFSVAPWETADLDAALAVAVDVATKVQAGEFWPPADTPPAFSDDLAAICQQGQYAATAVATAVATESEGDGQ